MTVFGSRVLTGGILAVIGLITLRVLATVFGAIGAFLSFFFTVVLPVVLVVWLGYKLLKWLTRDKTTSYE